MYTYGHTLSLPGALPIYHLAGEILHRGDRVALLRCDGQGEQRQPAGRGEAPDLRIMREGLQRDVEGGAGIFDGPADQRLHGGVAAARVDELDVRSEEHTSELPSLMRRSYAVLCLN